MNYICSVNLCNIDNNKNTCVAPDQSRLLSGDLHTYSYAINLQHSLNYSEVIPEKLIYIKTPASHNFFSLSYGFLVYYFFACNILLPHIKSINSNS